MDEKKEVALRPALYGMDLEEAEAAVQGEGVPRYRARQILEWIYQKNIADLAEAKTLPVDLRTRLNQKFHLQNLQFEEAVPSANGESVKFLFRTRDGKLLESVLIKQRGRRTVCVSTQLGCKIGCSFCASGKGPFGRDLTAGEIVEQVSQIERYLKSKMAVPEGDSHQKGHPSSVSNVVFMGMGEPLDNFEPTMKALKILQAPWGLGMGARRITVSTSGITPKILEFVNRSEGRVRLSVSLHSSQEKTRTELVPINKRYTLRELTETLRQIHRRLKREITFEYTLIEGINDSREEAGGVVRLAKPLGAKVNLIPYNPIREKPDYRTPSPDSLEAFRRLLERGGLRVTVRQTAGRDIDAACGQLRLDRENKP